MNCYKIALEKNDNACFWNKKLFNLTETKWPTLIIKK